MTRRCTNLFLIPGERAAQSQSFLNCICGALLVRATVQPTVWCLLFPFLLCFASLCSFSFEQIKQSMASQGSLAQQLRSAQTTSDLAEVSCTSTLKGKLLGLVKHQDLSRTALTAALRLRVWSSLMLVDLGHSQRFSDSSNSSTD